MTGRGDFEENMPREVSRCALRDDAVMGIV